MGQNSFQFQFTFSQNNFLALIYDSIHADTRVCRHTAITAYTSQTLIDPDHIPMIYQVAVNVLTKIGTVKYIL